ncbi:MAG: hypothetical protein KKA60_09680 [Proteobacteria bacterium]|nr:hypothetical protein [Pseudomonadota bacterium]
MRNLDDQIRENPRFLAGPVKDAVDRVRKITTAPVILGGRGTSWSPVRP